MVILAAQLSPGAVMAATLFAASLMIGEGLRLKRLDLRPRTHRRRLPRVLRRRRHA